MTELEQIREIERVIFYAECTKSDCEGCPAIRKHACSDYVDAKAVYDAGYRKAEEVRKETARECLKILHSIGGCGATEDYSRGWDNAINEAYKEISDKYGVTAFEEEDENENV